MNPWIILGWIFLGVVTILILIIVYALLRIAFRQFRLFVRYWKTRKVAPEVGQVWEGKYGNYRIERVLEDGRFVLHAGSSSWAEDLKTWRNRVYNRRLRLRKKA